MPLLEASILRGSNAARGHSTMRFVRLLGLCPLGAGLLGCRRRRRCCAAANDPARHCYERLNAVPCAVRISSCGLCLCGVTSSRHDPTARLVTPDM